MPRRARSTLKSGSGSQTAIWQRSSSATPISSTTTRFPPLYEDVIKSNPADYRGWFFRAGTFARLGRIDEAVDHYAWGLTVRPRYEGILQAVGRNEEVLGLRVHDEPFHLRALARPSKNGVELIYDHDKPYWLAYAIMKGGCLGEPEVRQRLGTANVGEGWNSKEEEHALIGLVAAYRDSREGEDRG